MHVLVDELGLQILSIECAVPDLLTEVFEDDVQTVEDVDLIYGHIKNVVEARAESSSFSGNTSTVIFHPGGVRIESDVSEVAEIIEMSLSQYLIILKTWAGSLVGGEG
ncbi:MAG: hypothetical protein M3Y91_14500 [Actinomycetota bacterium]|nr:hypothetical protein [Actinomycetota bacterium]